jgi:hypothetical protein
MGIQYFSWATPGAAMSKALMQSNATKRKLNHATLSTRNKGDYCYVYDAFVRGSLRHLYRPCSPGGVSGL